METAGTSTSLTCTQCGGELHPDEGQTFLTCPYCSATVYIDKSRVVFHWYLAPTLDENRARGELARWMAGNQTVKDLDKKASLVGMSFQYFPVWYIKFNDQNREQVSLEPGAATSVTELRRLHLPAGDLRKYDYSLDSQSQAPNVPLEAALGWLQQSKGAKVEVKETSLVHIPLYTFKYNFQNQTYTALVEAGTGEVLANIYPAKAEAPYLLAAGITALVYLCLALVPIAFSAFGGGASSPLGIGLCLGLGVLAAPFLFTLAVWVASKV
jgi:predicted RNA-binding Zn-ribbon protein involved in translation (DUF1610 family)